MTTCPSCGAEVSGGRFCTSCGLPLERPPAKLPPPAPADLPPAARFRMFVDEELPLASPPPTPTPAPAPPRRDGRPWLAWVAVGVALALVAGLGGWLLTRGEDDGGGSATGTPSAEASQVPSDSASPEPGGPGIVVPATAPPNQDVNGNPVTYDGANLRDGSPATCWRMPGDGTGEEITVTLASETRLRSVGIINGYAKTATGPKGREVDWYHGNRRVLQVEWVFDDGTTVVQNLDDTTEMQSVDVDAVTTTVVVRLLQVSPPGDGPDGRDFTAISELSLVGR